LAPKAQIPVPLKRSVAELPPVVVEVKVFKKYSFVLESRKTVLQSQPLFSMTDVAANVARNILTVIVSFTPGTGILYHRRCVVEGDIISHHGGINVIEEM
jgi:hypothetical protein